MSTPANPTAILDGPVCPGGLHWPTIASMSGNPVSVDTHPTDVTVLSLRPKLNLMTFESRKAPRQTSGDSTTLKSTFAIRFTGDPTGGKSTANNFRLVNSLCFNGVEKYTSLLTPSTSAAPPLLLGPPRICTIDSSPTSANVCNFPSLKNPNFSAQY